LALKAASCQPQRSHSRVHEDIKKKYFKSASVLSDIETTQFNSEVDPRYCRRLAEDEPGWFVVKHKPHT
jgi:hypothetical protein